MIFYLQQITSTLAAIVITGSVIQSFLLESGCTESRVSVYVSVIQAVQVIAMLFFSNKIENTKHIFGIYASTYYLQIILFVVMLYMSIFHEHPIDQKYLWIFVVSLIVGLFQGINNVLSYKIPFYILDMKRYGKVTGTSGVLLGILGAIFSATLSYFVSKYPYFYVMAIFSGIGLVFTTLSGILIQNYDNRFPKQKNVENEPIHIFRYKPFYQLLMPNLFRGISNGIFLMMVTIGYFEGILDGAGTGVMVTIAQIATIIGCFLYSLLAGRVSEGKIILVSGALFALVLPFAFVTSTQKYFFVIYLISYFLYNIVNYAIPVLIARKIDYQCIGQYSAWRMVIHMGGTAIGNAIVPVMLNVIGSFATLVCCGVLLFVCTYFYYRFECKKS